MAGSVLLGGQTEPKLSETARALQNVSNAHDSMDKLLTQLGDRLQLVTVPQPEAAKAAGNAGMQTHGSQLATMIQASSDRAESFNRRLRELLASLAI